MASELSVTKAAAWAWLEHGPGPLEYPEREYGLTRARLSHGPSRYKLEADKLKVQIRDGSRLLDRYEIDTISKRIDDYVEVHKHEAISEKNGSKKTKKKKKNGKGFGFGFGAFLLNNGLVCVPREDEVVDMARKKINVDKTIEDGGVKMILFGVMEGRARRD